MNESLNWLPQQLAALRAEDLLRGRRVVVPLKDGRCQLAGQTLVNFATNDYLGLAFDSRLIAAARAALDDCGVGARASALVSGRTPWHDRLERRLADFEGAEAALLFPTGYAANVGVITALAGPGDTVYCNRLNHASLIDGCRLSGARLRIYPHGDLDRLERELHKPASRRRLIVTDGVFSMDGDIAPLAELCDLAERSGAMLLVDEAHGTGVFGDRGRGACELAGVEDRVSVRVGTLSKAVGVQGGFAVGCASVVEWLWNRARSQMFSTALAPALCAAALAAIDIIEQEAFRRRQLTEICLHLRRALRREGIAEVVETDGPIVPLRVGTPADAIQISRMLEGEGLLVPAIRPPTVPRGTSRLRISLSVHHTAAQVDKLVSAIARANQSLHVFGEA